MAELRDNEHAFKNPLPLGNNRGLMTVDTLRASLEARQKHGQEAIATLSVGFKSAFWAQIKIELEARKKGKISDLIEMKPSAENLYEIAETQAEIKVLNVLLNLEKVIEARSTPLEKKVDAG